MKRTRIYAYVKPYLKEWLDDQSAKTGDSVSDLIEQAIRRDYLPTIKPQMGYPKVTCSGCSGSGVKAGLSCNTCQGKGWVS